MQVFIPLFITKWLLKNMLDINFLYLICYIISSEFLFSWEQNLSGVIQGKTANTLCPADPP